MSFPEFAETYQSDATTTDFVVTLNISDTHPITINETTEVNQLPLDCNRTERTSPFTTVVPVHTLVPFLNNVHAEMVAPVD